MSTVLVCGAFGQGNPGDDALLTAFVRALRGHRLVVTAATPVVDAVDRTIPPTGRAVVRALREVDAVVVAGGTIFKVLPPSSDRHPLGLLARVTALQLAARARGLPFALVGVGAGELAGSAARRLARGIAGHADLLVLRDEESAAVLHDAGAAGPFRVGADPAWSLLGHPAVVPSSTDRAEGVLVALSHLADRDPARLTERLVAVVDHLTSTDTAVRLQPWQGGAGQRDARLADAIRERVCHPHSVELADPPADLVNAVATCGRAEAVLGLRFHSLVAAAAAHRPFVAVAHEPKLAGLARRLGQLAVPPHASPAVLCHAADLVRRGRGADQPAIDREVDAARHSLRLLRVVVSRGAEDELIDEGRTELTAGIPW